MLSGFAVVALSGDLRQFRRDDIHGEPGRYAAQRNLGKTTTETATRMSEFDPDATWSPVGG